MADDPTQFAPRRPRHPAAGSATLRVCVEIENPVADGPVEAELLDLSRTGLQLRLPYAVEEDQRVAVRLEEPASGIRLELDGTVCWRRPEPDGTWVVGCQLAEQIAWESLGELFLNEVLAAEPPAAGAEHQE